MKTRFGLTVVIAVCAGVAAAGAETIPVVDFDRGEIPHETHANLKVHLTTDNCAAGHVGLAILPKGSGWVTVYTLWDNWTPFDRVRMSLHNANSEDVAVHFEVRSRDKSKATKEITLKPGANDVTVKFAEMEKVGERPLGLLEVGQWVLAFDKELKAPVTLSDYRLVRESLYFERPTEASIAAAWQAEEAELSSQREEPAGGGPAVYWASARFSATGKGRVWMDLRPGDKSPNTFAPVSTWTGYEQICFTCDNKDSKKVNLAVLLEDYTAVCCRLTEYREGQLVVLPVELKPGVQEVKLDLKDLKTADGQRWLDLSNVRRIGFGVTDLRGGLVTPRLRFSGLRIRTTSETAGVLVPEGGRRCERCGQRVDDTFSNLCPFCGKLWRGDKVPWPATAPAAVRLTPVKDASVNATDGGGGKAVTARNGKEASIGVHHYDESAWEQRALLRFDPAELKLDPAKIKKAELRLFSTIAGSQGKAYLCPIRVFAAPDGKDDFDEAAVNWLTQPPIGQYVATGGLYYYWTDATACDVTQFIRDRLAAGKGPFTLVVYAFQAGAVKRNPHANGHHFPFYSREAKDEARRPCLYIEAQ
ncbi:MAG: DNRLRE domain-containing protein [Phycisphaerae bacterium]